MVLHREALGRQAKSCLESPRYTVEAVALENGGAYAAELAEVEAAEALNPLLVQVLA